MHTGVVCDPLPKLNTIEAAIPGENPKSLSCWDFKKLASE